MGLSLVTASLLTTVLRRFCWFRLVWCRAVPSENSEVSRMAVLYCQYSSAYQKQILQRPALNTGF